MMGGGGVEKTTQKCQKKQYLLMMTNKSLLNDIYYIVAFIKTTVVKCDLPYVSIIISNICMILQIMPYKLPKYIINN
jgi:hypothetical protein